MDNVLFFTDVQMLPLRNSCLGKVKREALRFTYINEETLLFLCVWKWCGGVR
jgi:hypothetical protein